jgi:hypothetical protein
MTSVVVPFVGAMTIVRMKVVRMTKLTTKKVSGVSVKPEAVFLVMCDPSMN